MASRSALGRRGYFDLGPSVCLDFLGQIRGRGSRRGLAAAVADRMVTNLCLPGASDRNRFAVAVKAQRHRSK